MPEANQNEWPDTPDEFAKKFGRPPATDAEMEWYFGQQLPGDSELGMDERLNPLEGGAQRGLVPSSAAEAKRGFGDPFQADPLLAREAEQIRQNQKLRALSPEPAPGFQPPITTPGEVAPTLHPERSPMYPNVYSKLGRLLRGG
jgi:hypothetical protein